MADELLKQAQEAFEGQIVSLQIKVPASTGLKSGQDFEGQKKAEKITTIVLALTGVSLPSCFAFYRCANN